MKRPLFVSGLLFMASLASLMLWGVWIAMALIPGSVFVVLLLPRWTRRQRKAFLGCVCCAFLAATAAWSIFQVRLALADRWAGETIAFTGYVTESDPYQSQLKTIQAQSPLTGRVVLKLRCYEEEGLEPGDWITGNAVLSGAAADGNSFSSLGVVLQGVAGELHTAEPHPGLQLFWRAARLRNQLTQAMTSARPGDETGVITGLLFSQRSYLPPVVQNQFDRTGTGHILSVSGLHLAIVIGWVLWVCQKLKLGRWGAFLLGTGAILFLVLLAGLRASVLRAGVMMFLWLLAGAIRRRSDGMTSLAAAAYLLLILCPPALLKTGFLMSFSATLGLLALAGPISRWFTTLWESRFGSVGRLARSLAGHIAIPLAAQLALIPVLMLEFGYLPLYSLPANLLITPLVWPALLLGGLAAVCFATPALAFAGPTLLTAAGWFAKGILWLTSQCSRLPGGILPLQLPHQQFLALTILGVVVFCALRRLQGRRLLRILGVAAMFCVLTAALGNLYLQDRIVVTACPGGTAVLRKGNRSILLHEGDSGYAFIQAEALLMRAGLSGERLSVLIRPPEGTAEGDYRAVEAFRPQVLLLPPEREAAGLLRSVEGIEALPLGTVPVEVWSGGLLSALSPELTLLGSGHQKVLKCWAGYGIISEADIPEDATLLIGLGGELYSPGGQVKIRRLWNGDSVAVLPPL